jgi:flagellar motor switch protein FliN
MASRHSPRKDPPPGSEAGGRAGLPALAAAGLNQLDQLRDVPIELSVQLDRKLLRVAEILDFRENSVIELSRSAGENVDLLMDGELVGNGEIVVIEDAMGLRITDLRAPDGGALVGQGTSSTEA